MALVVVTEAEILKTVPGMIRDAFEGIGATQVSTRLGYQGGNQIADAYWSEGLHVWFAPKTLDNRYWNAFGTQKPKQEKMVSITCEINFPLSGINRQIGGAIAKDEMGDLFLVHRGRIGGGTKGIGPKLFWDHFTGTRGCLIEGKSESRIAIVSPVGSPRLVDHLTQFVHYVEHVKSLVRAHKAGDEIGASEFGAPFEIGEFAEKYEGPKTYTLSQIVEASCRHATIVNCLEKLLRKRGYSVASDQSRDLYCHRDGKITTLFEIKSDISTTNVYGAVGQLFIHSVSVPGRPKLIFVAPERLGSKTRDILAKLGIMFLGYSWDGAEPEFPELATTNF